MFCIYIYIYIKAQYVHFQIESLTETTATIRWFDGMPSVKWAEFKRRENGKMAAWIEPGIHRRYIISDGFNLTHRGFLPGEVKNALKNYNPAL